MEHSEHSEKFYPLWAAITLPCVESAGIGECVSDIYQWSLAVVGIVAFVQIVYAGWLYLTAAGNTTKTGQAMSKISNAILGIVLLFSSYLILRTINPDLVGGTFSLPKITKVDKFNTGDTGKYFCDKDKVCIENFDVEPKIASLKTNTELQYKLKIVASAKAVDAVCGAGRERVAYSVLRFSNLKSTTEKIRGGTLAETIRINEFGDGKAIDRDFAEKLNEPQIDPIEKTVQYYAVLKCFGGSEKEIAKSGSITVLINP